MLTNVLCPGMPLWLIPNTREFQNVTPDGKTWLRGKLDPCFIGVFECRQFDFGLPLSIGENLITNSKELIQVLGRCRRIPKGVNSGFLDAAGGVEAIRCRGAVMPHR